MPPLSETLDRIAAGEINAASLVTAQVGLDGVAGAFEALGNPDEQVKVIVTPNRAIGPRPRLRRAGLTPLPEGVGVMTAGAFN